jgi:hypothetical protein
MEIVGWRAAEDEQNRRGRELKRAGRTSKVYEGNYSHNIVLSWYLTRYHTSCYNVIPQTTPQSEEGKANCYVGGILNAKPGQCTPSLYPPPDPLNSRRARTRP